MGQTTVMAVIDSNRVHAEYTYNSAMKEATTDVWLRLYRKYRTANGSENTVQLAETKVLSPYLQVSDNIQTLAFSFENVFYQDDLWVEAEEVRQGGLMKQIFPVAIGDSVETQVQPLPANPIKYVEHEENTPPRQVVSGPDTVAVMEEPIRPVFFKFGLDDLKVIDSSARVKNVNGSFVAEAQNLATQPFYAENPITNQALNPTLSSATDTIPTGYAVTAAGFIVTNHVVAGPTTGSNIWRIRGNNPNFFNAFNTMTVQMQEPAPLVSGLDSFTFSVWAKLTPQASQTLPFETVTIRVMLYDSSDTLLRTETKSISVSNDELSNFSQLFLSLQGTQIPLTATQYAWALETGSIEGSDVFVFELYLPQVEANRFPTSNIQISRTIQDRYESKEAVLVEFPLYMSIKTKHAKSVNRGFVTNTVSNKNGFQIGQLGNSVEFKVLDNAGTPVISAVSPPMPSALQVNSEVEYSVYIQAGQIEFFANQVSFAVLPLVGALPTFNQRLIVGSYEDPNTTINGPLLGFGLFRDRIQP